MNVCLKIFPHAEGLPLPCYATLGSAGVDLMAAIIDPIELKPFQRVLVPTGIALELPVGVEGQVRSRSGLSWKNGVYVLNAPGTIDPDYRGEIKVVLTNGDKNPFIITRGMRIAQLVIAEYKKVQFQVVEALENTVRGHDGFGSTGI